MDSALPQRSPLHSGTTISSLCNSLPSRSSCPLQRGLGHRLLPSSQSVWRELLPAGGNWSSWGGLAPCFPCSSGRCSLVIEPISPSLSLSLPGAPPPSSLCFQQWIWWRSRFGKVGRRAVSWAKKSTSCQLVLSLASSLDSAAVGDVVPTGRALGVNTTLVAAWGGRVTGAAGWGRRASSA